MFKYLLVAFMLPFILISPIYAEEPEQGDVIIQTDGTYNDHDVIEACEVGSMVKLDIGSFDTAYINNNFEINANIDGYIYFECGYTNDIKLAYYGINQTIFTDDISSLTDSQINVLKTLDYDSNLYIAFYEGGYIDYITNITSINTTAGLLTYNGYYRINADGSIRESITSSTEHYSNSNVSVFYLRYNGETIYNGLPSDITGLYNFEDVASVYVNWVYDSIFSELSSWVSGRPNINYLTDYRIHGGMECKEGDQYSARCNYYVFNGEYEGSDTVIFDNYMTIEPPVISIYNSASTFEQDRFYNGHYEILITFNDEYDGYMDIRLLGGDQRFYINGNELRFNYTPSQYLGDYGNAVPGSYDIYIVGYALKRNDVLVDGTNESQNSEQANNAMNDNLNNTVSNFEAVEQSYNDSIDSGLNSIDFEAVNFGDSFLQSSSFVVSAFDAIVMSSPLGDYLTIVLIIGLFLLIVGRYL